MVFAPLLVSRITYVFGFHKVLPSDAIWRHRSESTLAQVMACRLTTDTKPLPEPILTWHPSFAWCNLTWHVQYIYIHVWIWKNTNLRIQLHLPTTEVGLEGPPCVFRLSTLQCGHNGRDGFSNHQPHDCLLNRLFGRRSKKTSNSALLAFVRGIHRSPVNSPRKWQVTLKMFPLGDVIMRHIYAQWRI